MPVSPAAFTRVSDRRRDREQDITPLTYLGPEGKSGYAWVMVKGSSTPILVSTVADRTFAPGETVIGASVSAGGAGGPYTVIGPPGPGQVGTASSPARVLPARPAPPTGTLYSLFADADAGVYRAWKYDGAGKYLADRGILGLTPGTMLSPSCIVLDEGGRVAPGSFSYDSGGPGCWDPTADANHVRMIVVPGILWSAPIYFAGYLWWWEWPSTGSGGANTFTLYRARCDFSATTVAGTVVYSPTSGPLPSTWNGGPPVALSLDTAFLGAIWTDIGHEVTGAAAVSLPLAGGSGATAPGPVLISGLVGLPNYDGTSALLINIGSTFGSFATRPAVIDAVWAAAWPTDSAWTLAPWYNASLSGDRKTASIYGSDGSGGFMLLTAPSTSPYGTAPKRVTVQASPVLGQFPHVVYLGS